MYGELTHSWFSRELGPSSRFWWNVNWFSPSIQWAWLSIKKYDECCLFIPVICPAVDGQPTTLPVSQSHSMRHAWHRKLADLPFVIGLFVNTTFIHIWLAGNQRNHSAPVCMGWEINFRMMVINRYPPKKTPNTRDHDVRLIWHTYAPTTR